MGQVSTEQTVAIIDAVAEATKTPEAPWWQIAVALGGTVAALLTAWVTLRKKPKKK